MPSAATSSAAPESLGAIYCFSSFRLDLRNRMLTEAGREMSLSGRAFDVLLLLLRHPGELLTKEEILSAVWQNAYVEESNLTVAISTLRRVLQEDPHDRRLIQTVARRGYRFIGEVREEVQPPSAAARASANQIAVTLPATPVLPLAAPLEAETAPIVPAFHAPVLDMERETASLPHQAVEAPAREREVALIAGARVRIPPAYWPLLAFSALLAVGIVVLSLWLLQPGERIHSIAVLPAQATGDPASDAALLTLTDALVTKLEPRVPVRPTSAVLRYLHATPADLQQAGREQSVDAVLTESLRAGTQGASTLQLKLVRVRDGTTLWQQGFARKDTEALQMDAGAAVLKELDSLHVRHAQPSVEAAVRSPLRRTDDPAYALYERGRFLWNQRTEEGMRKSADYFKQAINADPNYAPAYAGLADSYALLASFSVEPGRTLNADARSAALSAIQLDGRLAEPHASLGMILFFTDWNLRGAEREFEQAIALDPSYATAHHWYALDLAAMGRFPEALYEIRLAQKLDPVSMIIATNVGWIEYLARDDADATSDLHRVLELDHNFVRASTRLGMLELAMGKASEAAADLTTALRLSGNDDPWVEGLLGDALARSGDTRGAERILTQLQERGTRQYVPPISCALVLLGLGRRHEALQQFQLAVGDHSTAMVYARFDPLLDELRSDPEFAHLTVALHQ